MLFYVVLGMGLVLAIIYVAFSAFGAFSRDHALFSNAGAIGVGSVVVFAGVYRRANRWRDTFTMFQVAAGSAELLHSVRADGTGVFSGRTLHTAEQVKGLAQRLTDSNRRHDRWLFWELLFVVFFSVQWGFGGAILGALGLEG